MQYVPRLNPKLYNLEPLLAAAGRTLDWLNTDDGDPYTESNIARYSVTEAANVIPLRFRDALPSQPDVLNWITQVIATARQDQATRGSVFATITHGPSLLLLGTTGVGKTHEAYGAIRSLAVSGVASRWQVTTAADLYAALRPRHGVDSEAEFRTYRDARALLVDDLGADRKPTEFTEEVNFRLINWRYERQLPTLFTSNVLPQELVGRLGDRVMSRLVEMCGRVVIKGQDRRLGGAA